MSTQALPDAGKIKAHHSWLQRLAANLGFSSATGLRETLERAVAEADSEGEDPLPLQERNMIVNVLGFGALRVSEVMAPRVDIVATSKDQPVSELLQLFASSGHSRLPVFEDSLDEVIGMVHIKDVIAWFAKSNNAALKLIGSKDRVQPIGGASRLNVSVADAGLIREILFVPSSMSGIDLLAKMKAQRIQLAIVIDEFGGTDGLVSMEDLVEEIVGDIADEHDKVENCDIAAGAEGFVVNARTPIEAVEQALGGVVLAYDDATGDVDTLGGLIMAIEGSMPGEGQFVRHPSGVAFEILEASQRRIEKVRIHPTLALPAPGAPELQLALPAPTRADPEGVSKHDDGREPSARAA